MFSKTPPIRIDSLAVEKVEIHTPFHPFWEEVILDHLREYHKSRSRELLPVEHPANLPAGSEHKDPAIMTALDYASRVISILSGAAVIVFVALVWVGQTTIGSVQIGTLLTIFSFALVGGIISIGGVKMFSINANLRKTRETIKQIGTDGCPFLPLFMADSTELRRPGNPYYCMKCPLGIDIASNHEGGLIHVCRVYLTLHRQWKELPGADKVLDNHLS
jgi:hypothetical protein